MALTDTAIRNAKPGERPMKLSDGGGLHLLIQPRGSKLWRLAYRFSGKQKTLALGIYPDVTLAEARDRRAAARKLIEEGTDPSLQRKTAKHENRNTFRAVASELLNKMKLEGRAEVTLYKVGWILEFALSELGDQPIAKIGAPELLSVLRKIEARGQYETARRLRSTCGMVFRLAIATGRAERDPSVDLRGALITPKVKHRATITDPTAIGALLRDIDRFDGQPITRAALRLAPLVFVRPGELRQAEWKEFDLEGAEWRISSEKMKMRRPHRVPLSRQALNIIHELRSITGSARWVFPSSRGDGRPMSENTLNAALRRMGYSSETISAHGFRAMAATRLNEMGRWNSDAIERQLACPSSEQSGRFEAVFNGGFGASGLAV